MPICSPSIRPACQNPCRKVSQRAGGRQWNPVASQSPFAARLRRTGVEFDAHPGAVSGRHRRPAAWRSTGNRPQGGRSSATLNPGMERLPRAAITEVDVSCRTSVRSSRLQNSSSRPAAARRASPPPDSRGRPATARRLQRIPRSSLPPAFAIGRRPAWHRFNRFIRSLFLDRRPAPRQEGSQQ